MRRTRLPPMISGVIKYLGLLLAWVTLTGHYQWLDIAGGLAVAALVLQMDARESRIRVKPDPRAFATIIFFLCYRIITGTWAVCRDVLLPGGKQQLRPAFLALDLDSPQPLPVSLGANCISLTPGSLSLYAELPRRRLYIHSLYASDPQKVADQVRREFLRPMHRLFQEEDL